MKPETKTSKEQTFYVRNRFVYAFIAISSVFLISCLFLWIYCPGIPFSTKDCGIVATIFAGIGFWYSFLIGIPINLIISSEKHNLLFNTGRFILHLALMYHLACIVNILKWKYFKHH
jgi:hypothetical protein